MSISKESGKGSVLFFQKQFAGEQALTSATAERLYDRSAALAALAPWRFVDQPPGRPHCRATCEVTVQ